MRRLLQSRKYAATSQADIEQKHSYHQHLIARTRVALANCRIAVTFEILFLGDKRKILVVTMREPGGISLKATQIISEAIEDALAPDRLDGIYWRGAALAPAREDIEIVTREVTLGDYEEARAAWGKEGVA